MMKSIWKSKIEKYNHNEISIIVDFGIYIYEKARTMLISEMNDDKGEMVEKLKAEMEEKYKNDMVVLNNELKTAMNEKMEEVMLRKYEKEKKDVDIENALNVQKGVFEMMEMKSAKEKQLLMEKIVYLEKEVDRFRDQQYLQKVDIEKKISEKAVEKVKSELSIMEKVLTEKDKYNEQMKTMFESSMEKINKMTEKKDVVAIGKYGENQFMQIAQYAFRDFDGFEIEDVHKHGGAGDFHIQFKEFNVLVDSKMYSNKVNSTSREKIKRDLMKNEHIHFAWLVSLNTMIDRYDKAPFMFEWLSSQQCVCYVNCLIKNEEPGEILRALYFCCKTLDNIMQNEEKEATELTELRKKQLLIKEIGQKMVKNKRERETLMTQLMQNMEKGDEYIKELLNNETNMMVDEYMCVLVKWWQSKVVKCDSGGGVVTSTVLWNQFKKDNGELAKKMDIGMFKKMVLDMEGGRQSCTLNQKGNSFELIGMKIKC